MQGRWSKRQTFGVITMWVQFSLSVCFIPLMNPKFHRYSVGVTAVTASFGTAGLVNLLICCRPTAMSSIACNHISRCQFCEFGSKRPELGWNVFKYCRATSGIDYNVKIWTPSEEESVYDEKQASDVGFDVVWIWSRIAKVLCISRFVWLRLCKETV